MNMKGNEPLAKEIIFSNKAIQQLDLILQNDFTLKNKYLRFTISGKGCNGFEYSLGFTELHENDFMVKVKNKYQVIFDPFVSFYLNNVYIDYKEDFLNDKEGFIVKNIEEKKFHGKFWKQNKELTLKKIKL